MNLYLGCVTDRGSYRKKNQDRIMCASRREDSRLLVVSCVCDGIGSFEKSEGASELMVNGIRRWFDGIEAYYPDVMDQGSLVEDLAETIQELNELVYEYKEIHRMDTGCTMSLLLLVENRYHIFHVGDSRIYCLRDRLFQLTTDETVHKKVNGIEKSFLVNYIGKKKCLQFNIQSGQIKAGEVYILCSDGLYKKLMLEDVSELAVLQGSDRAMEVACERLLRTMLERGERDNISCALLRVGE